MNTPTTPAAGVPPHLKHGRKATWFELFFDLAFVTAVAQLTGALAAQYDGAGLLRYAFLVLLLWWVWLGHTFHATRFDEDRPDQHRLGMAQIAAVVLMAYGAGDALGARGVAFAAGMAAMKALLALAYLRERHRPQALPLVRRYAAIYAVQTALWAVSCFIEPPLRAVLWIGVLALDLTTPALVARQTHAYPPHAEHLPERFALFTLIVMGENVASTLHALLHGEQLTGFSAALAALGLVLAYLYWTGYYQRASGQGERRVADAADGRRLRRWAYGHIPLLLGLGGSAAGVVVASAHGEAASAPWLLGGSIAAVMAGLTLIGSASSRGVSRGRAIGHALLALLTVASALSGSLLVVLAVGTGVSVLQVRLARTTR